MTDKQSEDPLPYSFHLIPKPKDSTVTPARVLINSSILTDALEPPASSSNAPVFSPEDVFELWCEPQAVFRVRSVGRCSATLSGELMVISSLAKAHFRSCFAHLVLCTVAHWKVRRYWLRRRHLPSVGYGDGDAKGELARPFTVSTS